MSFWVHCNKCFTRLSAQFKFYITNCYHVYCENCLEQLKQRDSCLLCNSNKPAFLQINNEMPDSVKILFAPFEGHVEKTHSFVKFQMKNCSNLLQQCTAKYNKLKTEYAKLNHLLNVVKSENQKLKEALMMRQSTSRHSYVSSTPALEDRNLSSASSPYFNNISMSTVQNSNSNHRPHSGHVTNMQKMPQPNYHGLVSNPAQRMFSGTARLSRRSPMQTVSGHTFSSRSSGLNSPRNLSLRGSGQRQPHPYRTANQEF